VIASVEILSIEVERLRSQVAERDVLIAALRGLIQSLEGKNGALEGVLVNHSMEILLLKRKLFGTKSERTGTSELQMTLAGMLADLPALQRQLEELSKDGTSPPPPAPPAPPESEPKERPKPKGRRDLSASTLPRVVVELPDPVLAAKGKIIDYDESYQLMYQRAHFSVLVKRVPKYELPTTGGGTTVLAAEAPRTLFARSLCHTSVFAWLAVEKFALGVPHYRLEQHLEHEAESLDRGTMGRYMEELGGTLGATVVNAMVEHARSVCRVLSTDATGAAIQPGPREGGAKQACKKGHFFTIVADCDHVLYEFTSSHTSAVVQEMFKGFSGYLQSDASSVYDILDKGPPREDDQSLVLVGCWAHCRRYFFEAAVCKYKVGVEGLERIRALYHADEPFRALPPAERKKRRLVHVAPLVDDFFRWVNEAQRAEPGRTLGTKALGYAKNQEHELRRVLLDGRLPLDNTRSERALRKIVVGRKNWLFYGSETHAQSAAAIFSILASCRLHRIDPLSYLDAVLRVLPYWPTDRYLELAPLAWKATLSRLDANELARPIGAITVPPPLQI